VVDGTPTLVLARPLDLAQLQRWYDHAFDVFAFKGTVVRDEFVEHFELDPSASHMDIIVAVVPSKGGQIASSLRIFRRKMWLRGELVTVGGIGEVSTKKAYEGCGLARIVINVALERMRASGIEVSLLHTTTAAYLYPKLGWAPFAIYRQHVAYPVAAAPSSSVQIFSFDDDKVLGELAALHAAYVKRHTGLFDRADDFEYWRKWVRNEATPNGHNRQPRCFVSTGSGGVVVAYMIVQLSSKKDDHSTDEPLKLCVREAVWADSGDGAAGALDLIIAYAVAHFAATHANNGTAVVTMSPLLSSVVQHVAGPKTEDADRGYMVSVFGEFFFFFQLQCK